MRKIGLALFLLAAFFAGCSPKTAPPGYAPHPVAQGSAYVAPQSAPVRPPTYPSLSGPVVQSGTGYIPIVQGR